MQALGYHRLALDRYRDLGDTGRQADTQAALAESYAACGQHDQARDAWQQADALRRSAVATKPGAASVSMSPIGPGAPRPPGPAGSAS
jgi:tetratricopeptide (TPR) repeat protein